jgi:CheY-like chemotaxis protein
VETWRHLITQRRQQLSIDIPKRAIWLDVDPTRFTQVIANLLHNAIKFTPQGGRIDIVAAEEGGWRVLRVRDSGEGMAPEVLSHVFELFVQGPPPIDRPRGGLGLGLTLVRRLVELHGGTIEASSEGSGRGSEFTVRVPTTEPPVEVKSTRSDADVSSDSARRVLVVEDNTDAREALTMLLEESGHDVRAAADGMEALSQAEQFTPDVVLLDIGLPGLDGYAVARQLRASPRSADALLVAITGYGQPEDRALARAAGFDYHLLKPVESTRLFELLSRTR